MYHIVLMIIYTVLHGLCCIPIIVVSWSDPVFFCETLNGVPVYMYVIWMSGYKAVTSYWYEPHVEPWLHKPHAMHICYWPL